MKKNVTLDALEKVLQNKREWFALADRELDTALALEKDECADYWRNQLVRTSGAIGALEEVVDLIK